MEPDSKDTSAPGPDSSGVLEGDSAAGLREVYRRLLTRYGPQGWWPGESRLEVVLGAILTQGTAWTNVEKALANLKGAGLLSTRSLRDISVDALAGLLRPSGFFNVKARRAKAFIDYLWEKYGGDLDSLLAGEASELRRELLSLEGIGQETADDIVLYAAGKPFFVIDGYTRRIVTRLGMAPRREGYGDYQHLFQESLPRDASLYGEYHALLDRHAKDTCRVRPRCPECCLLELCPTGKASIDTRDSGYI